MVAVWATRKEKLIWIRANSKFIVVCLLWLLFKLTKAEERRRSRNLKVLLCSIQHPL